MFVISSMLKTSMTQIQLQVLNTISKRKVTLNNDLILLSNDWKQIKLKKLLDIICLSLSIIIFVINFHFIVFYDRKQIAYNFVYNVVYNQSMINIVLDLYNIDNVTILTKCSPTYFLYTNEWLPLVDFFIPFLITNLTIYSISVFIFLNNRKLNQFFLSLPLINRLICLEKMQKNWLILRRLWYLNVYYTTSATFFMCTKIFFKINIPFFNSFFTVFFYNSILWRFFSDISSKFFYKIGSKRMRFCFKKN